MRVKRVELALDEATGMEMSAIGCLLMVAQFIAEQQPDHADVLRNVARALIAQIPEERLNDIVRFAADVVRGEIERGQPNAGKVH